MKQRLLRLPTIVAIALFLGSCAPEVPQQVAYNEAAFAGYGGVRAISSGSSAERKAAD